MSGMAALQEYNNIRNMLSDGKVECDAKSSQWAREVIAKARADGRLALTEVEAKQVFLAYDLPITETRLATCEEDAVQMAEEVGFPVVMKIVSPDIIHKSDAGGVKVNIKDLSSAHSAFKAIMANSKSYKADADIHGVLVSEMAPAGTEVICGSVNDPTFGPTVMFGLGGIFVEVLKDVTFRVAPINEEAAMAMFPEVRSFAILQGARGETKRDQKALAAVLSRLSQLVSDMED